MELKLSKTTAQVLTPSFFFKMQLLINPALCSVTKISITHWIFVDFSLPNFSHQILFVNNFFISLVFFKILNQSVVIHPRQCWSNIGHKFCRTPSLPTNHPAGKGPSKHGWHGDTPGLDEDLKPYKHVQTSWTSMTSTWWSTISASSSWCSTNFSSRKNNKMLCPEGCEISCPACSTSPKYDPGMTRVWTTNIIDKKLATLYYHGLETTTKSLDDTWGLMINWCSSILKDLPWNGNLCNCALLHV